MAGPFTTPVAESVPFDPDNQPACPLTSEDVQAAIEELCMNLQQQSTPSFTWGKGGNAGKSEYLKNEHVECNKSGRLVPFDGIITHVYINNDRTAGDKVLEVIRRRPCQTGPWVVIDTLTLPNGDACGAFTSNAPLLEGDELGVRVKNPSASFKNPVVGLVIKNNLGNGAVVGSFLSTLDEGIEIEPTTVSYDFTGPGVTSTTDGAGNVTVTITSGGGGSGETNTASNVGGGSESFKQKTGVDLEFRTIVGGGNTTVTQVGDTIQVSTPAGTGEANTASNVGVGQGVFKQKASIDLEFKSLLSDNNLAVSGGADEITYGLGDINKAVGAHEATGGQVVTAGTTVTLGTQTAGLTNTGLATFSAGVFTIVKAGLYQIDGALSLDQSAGNGRSQGLAQLRLNGAIIPGTFGYMYHRNLGQGGNDWSRSKKLLLSVNDTIEIFAQKESGNATLVVVPNSAMLELTYLRSTN